METVATMRSVTVPNAELALRDILRATMARAFPQLSLPEPLVTVSKVSEYQCNNAMALVKALAQQQPPQKLTPQAVGEELKRHLLPNDLIDTFEPSAKGFINITLRTDWLSRMVLQTLRKGVEPPQLPHKHILIDFSAPNIAKEMHVGHLRSTIIGDCLARVFEFCQQRVDRINHIGDWGTAFGMLIWYIKLNYPDFDTNPPNISDLTAVYRAAKVCFDNDAEFKAKARLEVPKLQSHNPESVRVWRFICDVSRRDFDEIYRRLGVHLEERGESFYDGIIPHVLELLDKAGQLVSCDGAKLIISRERKPVRELDAKDMTKLASQHLAIPTRAGVVYHDNLLAAMRRLGVLTSDDATGAEVVKLSAKESKPWAKFDVATDLNKLMTQLAPLYRNGLDPLFRDVFAADGALVDEDTVMVPRFNFPLIAVKNDGGYTYDTTDIATAYHRYVIEKVDRNIYCTDVGQYEHFVLVAQVARDMGWIAGEATWDHVGIGLVTGADGKKIKTRSGDTVRLKDLLDEACERSLAILQEREAGERAQGHSAEEMAQLAQVIGIGAVKYYDLKQCRTTTYAFNYDTMLDLNGNTAVFLLYQYARMQSIKQKAGVHDDADLLRVTEVSLDTPQEKRLALCALRFQSVVLKTQEDLFPHHLTDFAYELMTCFSDFFQHCRVIDDPKQDSRLCLLELTRLTLKKTLDLLNIETVNRI